MSILQRIPSFNSSVTSTQYDSYDDSDTIVIKNRVKELLKSRIFLGRYIERRLVDERIGYRDIVVISAAEVELKRDLLEVQYKLRSVYPKHWIGITDTEAVGYPSAGVCLWTQTDNQPFGPFWFQIKSLKFKDEEVLVVLKCLRHITDAFLEIEPLLTGVIKTVRDSDEGKLVDTTTSFKETYTDIVGTLKSALSITNMKEFVTFLLALIIAVFTGSTTFVNFLGNFILALIRELSILVKNSTPMLLGLLDFFSKIIGGCYILLAMLFRPNTPAPLNKRSINYHRSRRSNKYQYDDNQFD